MFFYTIEYSINDVSCTLLPWGSNIVFGGQKGQRCKTLVLRKDGIKDRRKWDEIRKKRLLCLYYHSPILLLGFSYDAYMMLLSCSYVGGARNPAVIFTKKQARPDGLACLNLIGLIGDLEQAFEDGVVDEVGHGDLEFGADVHGALDGEHGAFVAGPGAAGDAVVNVPVEHHAETTVASL